MRRQFYEALGNWVLFVSLQFSTPVPGWELWATCFWWGSLVFGIIWTAMLVLTAIGAAVDPSGYRKIFLKKP